MVRSSRGLDAATSEGLDSLGKALNATYLAVRLASLLPLCAMVVGHDNFVIGTLHTTRRRVELQRMFGPLFEFLKLPMRCNWQSSFRDLVGYTQKRMIAVQAIGALPRNAVLAEYEAGVFTASPSVLRVRIPTHVPPVHFGGLSLTRSRI